MSTIINADTSDGLKFTSDTSGEIKLQSAGADIATVNSSGITMASGKTINGNVIPATAPAFSAIKTTSQSISHATLTKVEFNSEEFDTQSCFDTSTYKFTPNVAGYYQFNGQVRLDLGTVSGSGEYYIAIYKNGSMFKRGYNLGVGALITNQNILLGISSLIYANGTTDYFELYAFQNSSTTANFSYADNPQQPYFQAFLAMAV